MMILLGLVLIMIFLIYINLKAELSERALELLALPDDGVPRLLLDIGKSIISLYP